MMNILEQSEALKNIPEDALMREMQQPTGSMPQFLVLTELKRRKRVRDEYNRRQAQDVPTVAEEVVMGAGVPQEGIMQMSKSMAPKSSIAQNTGQQDAAPKEPTMGMASGGILSLAEGDKLGKPVVYNGKTYIVDDRGQVYFNRRRVANRNLREAVLQKATSDVQGNIDESPAPQAQTGSQLLDQAQASLSGSQMFSPSGITRMQDNISAQLPSALMDAQSPAGAQPEIFDATIDRPSRDLDADMGIGFDPMRTPTVSSAILQASMPEDATPLGPIKPSSTFNTQPSVAREDQIAGENKLLDALTKNRFSTPDEQAPQQAPDYIPSSSSPTGFVDASTGRPVSGSVAESLRSEEGQPTDVMDFSNITAYPPTLSPMEIAARKNIAEQEATLPKRPLNIDATPPGFGSEVQMPMGNIGGDYRFDKDGSVISSGATAGELMQDREQAAMAGLPFYNPPRASSTALDLLNAGFTGGDIDPSEVPEEVKKSSTARERRRRSIVSKTQTRDGTASGGTIDIPSPMTGDPDVSFDLPRTEERPNIPFDPKTSQGDPNLLKRESNATDSVTSTQSTGASGTGGGAGGSGGSPLRSRIEQLIADREKDREADKWMALAQTGLALMASDNPTLGGAIGEAGLVGVGAMKEAKSQYDKDMLELLGIQEEMRQADLSYSAALAKANKKALPKPRTPAEINAYLDYYRDIEKKLGTVVEVDEISGRETRTFDPAKVPQDIKDEIFRLEEQYRSLFPSATVNLADV